MEDKKRVGKKILGIPAAMFVIGLLTIGGASAALLAYLSNTTVVQIGVNGSPLVLETFDGASWVQTPVILSNTTPGSTFTWLARVTNAANANVTGNFKVLVTNSNADVTCSDLTLFTADGNPLTCSVLSGVATYTLAGRVYAPGTTPNIVIDGKFGMVTPAVYEFNTTIMP